jgi:membrane protease YdiL (CAAX protease family)
MEREDTGERFVIRPMRRVVVNLSAAFGLLLTGVSWLVVTLQHRSLRAVFANFGDASRCSGGAVIGIVVGAVCLVVVMSVPALRTLRALAREGFEGIEPRLLDLFVIAAVAGFSEELLFRGVLQPVLGVWVVSVLFALMHGVALRRGWGNAVFAAFLFAGSVGLGFLYERWGLGAAMVAHAAYDLTVLLGLRRYIATTS